MNLKVKIIVPLITVLSLVANAEAVEPTEFVKKLFQRAKTISTAIGGEDANLFLLNGKANQEGFCQFTKDTIDINYLLPIGAGKDNWLNATEQQKQDFTVAAFTVVARFIAVGFQNYTQDGSTLKFSLEPKSADPTKLSVAVDIPADTNDVVIRLRVQKDGSLKMYDSIVGGIGTVKNMLGSFENARNVSFDNLIKVLQEKNLDSDYGSCNPEIFAHK